MKTRRFFFGSLLLPAAALISFSGSAQAANGTWNGTSSNLWQLDSNWSGVFPATGNIATFNNAGNGNTTLDISTGLVIANILFDTPSAAAYTIGSGVVNSQALNLNDSGSITVNSTVAQDEVFNSAITLGSAITGTYTFANNSPTNILNFAGNVQGGTGGTAAAKTLVVTGAGSTLISGIIANGGATSLALTKAGAGTLTLTNANAYTGNTTISGGTLKLDFTAGGAPATNIVSGSSALKLGGGTLQIVGASGGSTQTFASTSFTGATGGQTVISAAPVSGTIPIVNLGVLSGTQGALVRFDGAAYNSGASSGTTLGGTTIAATATFNTTTNTGTNGIIQSNTASPANSYATVGLYDWGAMSTGIAGTAQTGTIVGGSQISGFYTTTNATSSTGTFGTHLDLTGSATMFNNANVSGSYGTVRFNAAGPITLTTARALGGSVIGGLLVTPNVGVNNVTIAPNTGQSQTVFQASRSTNGATGLTVWQNNTAGELIINANYNNGSNTATTATYTQGGAGTVVLAASNGYTGQTYLNGGTTVISANTGIGAVGTGATVNINGGTLFGNATFALDNAGANNRGIFLSGIGGTLAASAGNAMSVTGVITGAATAPLSIGTGSIAGTGAGTANTTAVVGSGTVILSAGNTYSGGTNVKAGTLQINGINALGGANYGGLTLNGGTLKYASAFTGNGSGDLTSIGTAGITIGSGGGTVDTNGNSVTYAGSIGNGGSGGLTVTSSSANGSLTLGGANTYTGGTIVNGGVLRVNNATGTSATGSGAVAVNSAATLGGSGFISGAVTVNTGGIIAPGNSVGTLTVGGLTLGSGSILNFEFNTSPANDFVNVTGADGLTINGGGFNLYNEGTTSAFSTAGIYNLIGYTGAIGGTGTSALSVLNPQPGKNYAFNANGTNVTLDVTLSGVVSKWNVDADGSWNTSGNWSAAIPNGIGETAEFTTALTAVRTLTLDGSKTLGALSFDSGASPLGYVIAAGSGGTLSLNNGVNQADIIGATGANVISSAVSLDSTNTVAAIAAGSSLTISGSIGGTGNFVKSGAGLADLTNVSNTFGGNASVSGGTLGFAALASLGGGKLTIDGGTLRYDAGNTADVSVKTVTVGASGAVIDTNGNDVTYANAIGNGGIGALTKAGTGTLALQGANSYTGATSVLGGTLSISTNANLGDQTTGAGLTLNGGTLRNTATLALDNAGANNRAVTIGAGGGVIRTDADTTLTISGNLSGAGALVKTDAGTLILSGNNAASFSGAVSINGGILQLVGNAALGNNAVSFNGGSLQLNAGATLNNSLSVGVGQTATLLVPTGATIGSALTGAGTFNVNVAGNTQNYQGNWSAFTGQINLTGTGDFRISNFQSQVFNNAKLNIGAGVYVYQNFNPPTASPFETVQVIGELSGAAGSILGGNPVGGRFVNWTVGGLNTSSTFSGVIQNDTDPANGLGEPKLTKVGTGTLTLAGASTYTGATTVSAGTLLVNGSLGNTAVAVNSGGTLGGTNGVIGVPVTGTAFVAVNTGGMLAPGNSAGTLTVNGSASLNSGSTYAYQYTGGLTAADLTDVNGSLTIASGAILTLQDLGAYTVGDKFTLFAYETLTGGFDAYANNSTYNINGGDWLFNYADTTAGLNGGTTSGNVGSGFITMTAVVVPEPSSLLLGSLGLLAVFRRRRN